jgi:DNA polymerase III sliding clamp (beta) subunit (PCNA family)
VANILDVLGEYDNKEQERFSIEIKQFVLEELLTRAYLAISITHYNTVFTNFHFAAEWGKLTITAHSSGMTIQVSTERVSVHQPGTVEIPAEELLSMVQRAESGNIGIEVDKKEIQVLSGSTKWTIPIFEGNKFPLLNDIDCSELTEVNKEALLVSLINLPKLSKEAFFGSTLPQVSMRNKKILVTNCSWYYQAELGEQFPEVRIDIPFTHIQKIIDFISFTNGKVISLGTINSRYIIQSSDALFVGALSVGSIEGFEKIILYPAMANKDRILVDKNELYQALSRVDINTNKSTNKIVIDISENSLTINAEGHSGYKAVEEINAVWEGNARRLVISSKQLLILLYIWKAKTCEIFINKDSSMKRTPILLKDVERGVTALIPQMVDGN